MRHDTGNPDEAYALHEVYYNEKGEEDACTENGIAWSDSPEGVLQVLKMMFRDAKKAEKDILDYDSFSSK